MICCWTALLSVGQACCGNRHVVSNPAKRLADAAKALLYVNLVRAFDDPDSLIHLHVAKGLRDVGRRPIDFDSGDGIRFAESDLGSKWVGSEAAAGTDPTIDRSFDSILAYRDANASADSGSIRCRANEPKRDPVIAEPWVQEEGVSRFVSRKGAPHFCKDILVAIVVDVSEGYPMALLQVAETARICHVRKSLTATVSKHDIGNQCVIAGCPSSQVEIQETVIIQIPKVSAHRQGHSSQPVLCCGFNKTALPVSLVKTQQLRPMRPAFDVINDVVQISVVT